MDDPTRRRLARLLDGASIEVSPHDRLVGEHLRDLFAPGMTVFVNHPASVTHHDIVAACRRLARAGFVPVPHLAARRLASFTQASDFLRRARAEAAVGSLLVIAGDLDRPAGPFRDSLDLLASGVIEHHGIGHILVAGYPEGHPRIGSAALDDALAKKRALARERGLDLTIVTQFGFEPEPIRRWLADLPARGLVCPVRIGVAGPASVATLAKFAVRCGVGASLRALVRRQAAFARVLTEATADALLSVLFAEPLAGAPLAGLHVFTFGGVRQAAAWLSDRRRAAQEGAAGHCEIAGTGGFG